MSAVPPLDRDGLRASAAVDSGALRVQLSGEADARVTEVFDAWMVNVAAEAERAQVREVQVDLRALAFMNSSCLRAFVTWLTALEVLPAEKQYRVQFIADPARHWQKRSLRALSCFAADLVTIQG